MSLEARQGYQNEFARQAMLAILGRDKKHRVRQLPLAPFNSECCLCPLSLIYGTMMQEREEGQML